MIPDDDMLSFIFQVPAAIKIRANATVDVVVIAANVIVIAATAVRVSRHEDTLAPWEIEFLF